MEDNKKVTEFTEEQSALMDEFLLNHQELSPLEFIEFVCALLEAGK